MSRLLFPFLLLALATTPWAMASEKPAPEKAPAAAPEAAATSGPQREYNPGKVLNFPKFSGESINSDETLAFKPTRGNSVVVIFIASWCEPCQVLMPELKQLARKHNRKSNQVFFVFSHDTKQDAAAFAKEHQLTTPALMSNVEILTDFKNPELPSVYIGDKWGYLADRFIKIQKSDIDALDAVIAKITTL